MSFYTSLCYYRPGNAPVITGGGLARFIQRVADTNLVQRSPFSSLEVKFGSAIDQDERETFWIEPTNSVVGVFHEIDWDIEVSEAEQLEDILASIANEHRNVYRASANLGFLKETIASAINREPSEENEIGFFPDSLSLSIGPVTLAALSSESAWRAGWVSLSLHGGGYLYPMTFDDLVAKASGSNEISQLCEICRALWPVPSRRPEPSEVNARQQHRDLWPYDNFDRTLDWCWGIFESG